MIKQSPYLSDANLKRIAFVDILIPYTKIFLFELEKEKIPVALINKMHRVLLRKMSSLAEVALQKELTSWVNNGQHSYQNYVMATNILLKDKYPVLDKMLEILVINYITHIKNIFTRFRDDNNRITDTFSVKTNSVIKDIDANLGDDHSGQSTALLTLSDDTKIIYKPRSIYTTESYNIFIDWINYKLNIDLKTIKCITRNSYGWLEYIPYSSPTDSNELEEYYYKSGILLATTLLLGSKDCHCENVIASGRNPVIIDHETIIQPVLSKQPIRTWDEQHRIPPFSVLESLLIANRDTGVLLEYTGYGIQGFIEGMNLVQCNESLFILFD